MNPGPKRPDTLKQYKLHTLTNKYANLHNMFILLLRAITPVDIHYRRWPSIVSIHGVF